MKTDVHSRMFFYAVRAEKETTEMEDNRSKLRDALKKKQAGRTRGNGPRRERRKRPEKAAAPQSTIDELLRPFPVWILHQLLRTHSELLHGPTPLMLLFRVNLANDSIVRDPSVHVGSLLDVLLMKINGGIYFEAAHHIDGLQQLVSTGRRALVATSERLIYVYAPDSHIKNATADIEFDISSLKYILPDGQDSIPAEWVRKEVEWHVPLLPENLPIIAAKQVQELPVQQETN